MSLFDASEEANRRAAQPLAARMRPATLDEFVGQQHFLGAGKLLRRLLAADRLGSVIFYGPPGTGKTTLARLLARESRSHFQQISAVASGVKELREVLAEAHDRLSASGQRTLLFVDEIHRFNKAQQDVLLPGVEEGEVILVGATTENPFFTINSAAGQPQPHLPVRAAAQRRHQDAAAPRGGRSASAAWASTRSISTTTPWSSWRRPATATPAGPSRPWRSACFPAAQTAGGVHPRTGRRVGAAEGGAIRSRRRRPLRLDQRADQEHSRQRSRRGPLLAGPDARRGRGRPLSRPAAGDPGQRGRGQCRSGRPAAGGGGGPGLRTGRAAGMPVDPGPGRHLPGLRPKSNAATVGIGEARHDVREGRLLPVPIHLRDSHYARRQAARATGRTTSTPTTARRHRRAGLPGRRARVLPARRSRLRAGVGRAAEGDPGPAARRPQRLTPGTGPFFGDETLFTERSTTENMDLSPSVHYAAHCG